MLDYLSNYILMPIVAITTCILIGWVLKPKTVLDEVAIGGGKFKRRSLYIAMIKIVAPIMLFFLFLQSIGILNI